MSRHLRNSFYASIAHEVASASYYFDRLLQVESLEHDDGALRGKIEQYSKRPVEVSGELPESTEHCLMLLNGNLNYSYDIESLLLDLKKRMSRSTRLACVVYNAYFKWLYALLNFLHLRRGPMPSTFLTGRQLSSLCRLAGFEILRRTSRGFLPFSLGLVGRWIESFLAMIPLVRRLGLLEIVWLRPIIPLDRVPSLSIIVPARNEKGNIEELFRRLPASEQEIEIIFIEGHSTDETWEEIQRVVEEKKDSYSMLAAQQTGAGKADAVRLGFSMATKELVTILDADLTMPPELLPRFSEAYRAGHGDFINGCRLLYPMEGEAMRFLNHLGNIFFAKALALGLDLPIGDSLCGTKLFSRKDAMRFKAWRERFGDFDPFGDFELLFPASLLHLGVVDLPIRYGARTYGSTNIRRFRDGLRLLKMTLLGFFTVRFGWRRSV